MCAQPSPPVPARAPLKEHPDDIGRCFSVHCGGYKKETDCNLVFGCFWCYKNTDGSLLKTPSCKSDRKCYGGVLGTENPFLLPQKERKRKEKHLKMFTILGLKLNKTTLIAASSALGALLLIVTVCCLCRRKPKYSEEEMEFQTMDMFAEEEQMMDPTGVLTNDQAFRPLQLNYPGQSRLMQSNMQMRLGASRMNYSTQAMSSMWAPGYAQSQLMSFGPQMSAMQAPGAYPRKPKSKRTRPKQIRKVSFSNDLQDEADEEPNVISEDSPTAREPPEASTRSEVFGNSEISQDHDITQDPEVIDNYEVEGMTANEEDGEY